jgi:hypothetical protein
MMDFDELPRLNAATVQEPLGKVAEAWRRRCGVKAHSN